MTPKEVIKIRGAVQTVLDGPEGDTGGFRTRQECSWWMAPGEQAASSSELESSLV